MREPQWDIRREGRRFGREESDQRWALIPEKFEEVDGKLFTSDRDRLHVLGMLLENVGMDRAVRLGDLARWREAIAAAGKS